MKPLTLPIASPPWSSLGKKIESKVRKAVFEYQMIFSNTSKIAIALSGGKDSLTLLYLLQAIRNRGFPNFELVAIHVSGSFSCGASIDALFLKNICDHLKIPLVSIETQKKPQECYTCSRERRSLIFEEAKKQGATTIAFGHHQEDSTQTLLLNLLHKGEFEPLMPKIKMEEYGITIIRPLIYVSEKEIIEFGKKYGFYRITCQCPIGQNSKRKDTEKLLLQMEKYFPNARNNLFLAGKKYGFNKALHNKKVKKEYGPD